MTLTRWTRPPEWLAADGRPETGHRIGTREEWTAAREELLVREKEHTRLGDELARQRRELPWVRVEKDYCPRHRRRPAPACGPVRRPKPAAHLPLHVRTELRGRLPDQLVHRGHHRWAHPAPECARRDDDPRVGRPHREAAGVQAPHGLEHPLGVVGPQRLQRRPRLLERRGRDAGVGRGKRRVAPADRRTQRQRERHRHRRVPDRESGLQRLRPRRWGRLPDLCDRVARRRVPDGLLPDPRPDARRAARRTMASSSGSAATTSTTAAESGIRR